MVSIASVCQQTAPLARADVVELRPIPAHVKYLDADDLDEIVFEDIHQRPLSL